MSCAFLLSVSNPCQKYPCENLHVCLLSSSESTGRACKCPDNLQEITEKDTGKLLCRPQNTTQACPLQCNQGLCKMVNNQPKCKCTIDFEGEFCEHYRCSGFCKNRGVCYVDASHAKSYNENIKLPLKCHCPPSWTGDHCEMPVINCTAPCYNGVCTVKFGAETCICKTGFTGQHCEHCNELQCENQGVCQKDQLGNARCECTKEFKGIRCENSPCEGFCSGHGECTIHSGSPKCDCHQGYWGRQCDSDECTDYCKNDGQCSITPDNEKVCKCMPNYSGIRCETEGNNSQAPTSDCSDFLCENGGTCHVIKNEAYCNCTAQYAGDNCRVSVVEIEDNLRLFLGFVPNDHFSFFAHSDFHWFEQSLHRILRKWSHLSVGFAHQTSNMCMQGRMDGIEM